MKKCLGVLVSALDVRCAGGLGRGVTVGAETMGRAGGCEYASAMQEITAATELLNTESKEIALMSMSASHARIFRTNSITKTDHSEHFGSTLNGGTDTSSTATATSQINFIDAPFIDILAWLNYMTFDVISSLAFGKALGMLEGEGALADVESDAHHPFNSYFQPEAVLPNGAAQSSSLNTSKQEGEPTPIHTLIDYRGRTAAFLGLFPAWHAILHPLLHRYARWVPDEFIRRGVSGTEVSFNSWNWCSPFLFVVFFLILYLLIYFLC